MVATTILANIFSLLCFAMAFLLGSIGFAALNENEEPFAALILGAIAVFLFLAGVHYIGPLSI